MHLGDSHGSQHGLCNAVDIGNAGRVSLEDDLPATVLQQLLRCLLIPAAGNRNGWPEGRLACVATCSSSSQV
jgi:hypothetical protein